MIGDNQKYQRKLSWPNKTTTGDRHNTIHETSDQLQACFTHNEVNPLGYT